MPFELQAGELDGAGDGHGAGDGDELGSATVTVRYGGPGRTPVYKDD